MLYLFTLNHFKLFIKSKKLKFLISWFALYVKPN